MGVVERILGLMEADDIKAAQLTRDLSLSHGVVTQWKQGLQKPSTDAIVKLADYFSVSTDYLLGRSDTRSPIDMPDKKKEPHERPEEVWELGRFDNSVIHFKKDESFQELRPMFESIIGFLAGEGIDGLTKDEAARLKEATKQALIDMGFVDRDFERWVSDGGRYGCPEHEVLAELELKFRSGFGAFTEERFYVKEYAEAIERYGYFDRNTLNEDLVEFAMRMASLPKDSQRLLWSKYWPALIEEEKQFDEYVRKHTNSNPI